MITRDHLVEQHYIEHEARLKHIDELIDSAHDRIKCVNVPEDKKLELQDIRNARDRLERNLLRMKHKSGENWEYVSIQSAGPMGIWDIVAQRIEKLVEYLEKRKH